MANNKAISNEEIITALLANNTIKEAAAAAGISERSLYDRMTDRDFKAAYNAAKSDIIRQAVYSINGKLTAAIDTITEIMNDRNAAAATRLQAAQTILNNAEKFSARLNNIESKIDQYTRNRYDFDF